MVGEEAEASANAGNVTPVGKAVSATKAAAKRTYGKTKPAKSASARPLNLVEPMEAEVEESKEEVGDAKNMESMNEEPNMAGVENDGESVKKDGTTAVVEEPAAVEDVGESAMEVQSIVEMEISNSKNVGDTSEKEKPVTVEVKESLKTEACGVVEVGRDVEEEQKEESQDNGNKEPPETANADTNVNVELQKEDTEADDDKGMEDGGKMDLGAHGDEEIQEDDAEDHDEETQALEDERRELTAVAKEHRIRKEREIFVGGLDWDAVEEDVRKVFEKIGEIVEIRLHKNPSTNTNKGYAFVEFAKKEHARRALLEMKNPVVCIVILFLFHLSIGFT